MDPHEIEVLWRRATEHALAFRAGLKDRPHRPATGYADLLALADAEIPDDGVEAEAVLSELMGWAGKGLHATAGPRFLGWVMGSSHPVGVAVDILTSAWGQNAGSHVAAPAAAVAETVAARWLLDLLRLPRQASVGFVTGATAANFVGLAAARGEVLRQHGWDTEAAGLFGAPPVTILIGDEAHTTAFAALRLLGFGHEQLRLIATDRQGSMRPGALEQAMAGARGPLIVILQAGQINTGSFDPFGVIVPLAKARSAWVHVDGAFGLWARACPSRESLAEGVDLADSWATDGHKWLQTPYDSGFAIVRNAQAHQRAMASTASYLPAVADGDRDPSHYVPELSRRARGFAAWAMLRHLGRRGLAAMIERHCDWCRSMADALAAEPGVTVMNDVVLNQAIVRFGADRSRKTADELTERTITRIQADGVCFVGGARWRGDWVMRISMISAATTEADVARAAAAILAAWRSVRSEELDRLEPVTSAARPQNLNVGSAGDARPDGRPR